VAEAVAVAADAAAAAANDDDDDNVVVVVVKLTVSSFSDAISTLTFLKF
jgi:hypothetical protein